MLATLSAIAIRGAFARQLVIRFRRGKPHNVRRHTGSNIRNDYKQGENVPID